MVVLLVVTVNNYISSYYKLSFAIRRCIINDVDTSIPSANGTAVDEIPANSIVTMYESYHLKLKYFSINKHVLLLKFQNLKLYFLEKQQ